MSSRAQTSPAQRKLKRGNGDLVRESHMNREPGAHSVLALKDVTGSHP